MDQGQPKKQSGTGSYQPFFTAGAGTNSENLNSFESENNLDLSNQAADWQLSRENNPRELGNKVIDASDQIGNTDINTAETPDQPGEESKEVALNPRLMPPDSNLDQTSTSDNATDIDLLIDDVKIKTTEMLNKESVRFIDSEIGQLSKDGNIESFYDKMRNKMEENLENSYGRKLAA